MARNTMEAWIPEEFDSEVIQRVNAVSAVERVASRVPMKTDTKSTPRSAGVGVDYIAKGGPYGEDASANDSVLLTAQKLGKAIRIAEEDMDDSFANVVSTKQTDWATSYGKALDNGTLAVTAASVTTGVPFISVYAELSNADTTVTPNYSANANITKTGTGGVTYAGLSGFLGPVEDGDYFDPDRIVLIAHPSFRKQFRGVLDNQGHPIFVQGLAGTPDTLFGTQVIWSTGARTSATITASPTGNPLLIAVNRDYLLLGIRSGPESFFIDGNTGLAALTDEAILKMRARRGFALGHPMAAAIYENNSGTL